jgi:TatD DNase family protein
MTDAHFHRAGRTIASLNGKEYIFCGIHPWLAASVDLTAELAHFRTMLGTDPSLGVGEIGLDRLKDKNISPVQREVFAAQLELAAEMGRPVVLHGAKCWGEVVKAIRSYAGRIPAFLFHGFSRSDGLLPDIVKVNGFIGVGKALLNDHAVNYRELAKKIPLDRLLIETDGEDLPDNERTALLAEILSKTAELT